MCFLGFSTTLSEKFFILRRLERDMIKNVMMMIITTTIRNWNWDRGSTVVKTLCYKLEDSWFDPSWCQWIFHWHNYTTLHYTSLHTFCIVFNTHFFQFTTLITFLTLFLKAFGLRVTIFYCYVSIDCFFGLRLCFTVNTVWRHYEDQSRREISNVHVVFTCGVRRQRRGPFRTDRRTRKAYIRF